MKLHEILNIPMQNSNRIPDGEFDLSNKIQVCTSENYPVFKTISKSNQNLMMYILANKQDTTKIISYIIGLNVKLDNKIYFQIEDAKTYNEYQNKGFMSALYLALLNKLNIPIISDSQQSPPMKKLWGKSKLVLDVSNLKILNRSDVPEDEIYTNIQDKQIYARYRLIYENTFISPLANSNILLDYENCTHPDNIGKYE